MLHRVIFYRVLHAINYFYKCVEGTSAVKLGVCIPKDTLVGNVYLIRLKSK